MKDLNKLVFLEEQPKETIMLAQDNKLTLSRNDFSPIEKRCLYFIIKEVRRLYIEKNLKKGDERYMDLFLDMYLKIKGDDLKKLGDERKDVFNSLKKLCDRKIEIDTPDMTLYTSWVLQAKDDKKLDVYEVQVSKDILPYLVELAEQFTEYSLTVALTLKSKYSQRFYELCCMYRNKEIFFLEIDKLRQMLKIDKMKSYENIYELKRTIIDIAQKELQSLYEAGQSDIYFTYRTKDTIGKKITSFWFDLHTKTSEEKKQLDYANAAAQIRSIMLLLGTYIKKDERYISRVKTALLLEPTKAHTILKKIDKISSEYDKKDVPKLIRFVLKSDFGII